MLDCFSTAQPEDAIRRMHKVLALGGVGGWVVLPLLFLSHSAGLYLVKAVVLVALPYIGWQLWQAQWRGWLTALGVVGLVMVVGWSLTPRSHIAYMALSAMPLLCALSYTSLLQHTVAEWLRDREWQHRFEQDDLRQRAT